MYVGRLVLLVVVCSRYIQFNNSMYVYLVVELLLGCLADILLVACIMYMYVCTLVLSARSLEVD